MAYLALTVFCEHKKEKYSFCGHALHSAFILNIFNKYKRSDVDPSRLIDFAADVFEPKDYEASSSKVMFLELIL